MAADALENLPDGCRQSFGTSDSMYVADPETARRHCLFENGLDEGTPLLVRNAAPYFDDRVFTPEAMKDLAKEEEHQKGFVVCSWSTVQIVANFLWDQDREYIACDRRSRRSLVTKAEPQ